MGARKLRPREKILEDIGESELEAEGTELDDDRERDPGIQLREVGASLESSDPELRADDGSAPEIGRTRRRTGAPQGPPRG